MHSGKLSLGLIVSFLLVVCQPQAGAAQLAYSSTSTDSVSNEKASHGHFGALQITSAATFTREHRESNRAAHRMQSISLLMSQYLKRNSPVKSSSKVSAKLAVPKSTPKNETLMANELKAQPNMTADVEEFSVIDNNQKHERTFSFITDFISNLMNRRTCVYPCTLEAYQENNCCPPELVQVPVPVNNCQSCAAKPIYPQPIYTPPIQAPVPAIPYAQALPQTLQCCSVCTHFTLYGPPPCLWAATTHFRQRVYQQSAF